MEDLGAAGQQHVLGGPESSAAARLHRSVSAARAAAEAIKAQESSYMSCKDDEADDGDDDSSLALYRDPSTASRRSRASVLSGAHQQGETFFTALKKQPSWQSAAASDLYSQAASDDECEEGSVVAALHAYALHSASHSAYLSAAGGGDGDGSSQQGADDDNGCLLHSSGNDSATVMQVDEAAAGPEHSVHGATSNSCKGEQLTSSVLEVINSLYNAEAGQAWQQPSLQAQHEALEDVAACNAAAAASSEEVRTSSTEPLSARPASSSSAQAEAAETPEQSQLQHNAGTTASETAAIAAAAAAASEADEADATAAGTQAVLTAVDGMLAEHSRLQEELGGYLQDLSSKADSEGRPLVQMSEDYAVLVERLLREGRAQQYRALEGWAGPHRFEDLPIAQLRSSSQDPQVAAGLAAIAKLDEDLREASLKALIAAQQLHPEQWADAEKRRLERRAAELDAALAKERQRRAHAAKLRGALNKLDEQCSQASLQSLSKTASLSYYRLKPHEEDLLAAVLARDESSLEADDPFDPMLLSWDDLDLSTPAAATATATGCDQHSKALTPPNAASVTASDSQPLSQEGSSSEASRTASVAAPAAHTDSPVPPLELSEAAAAAAGESGSETGLSALSSRLSAVFSLLRPSSAVQQGRRCSLAEIDRKLAVIQAERQAALSSAASQGLSRTVSSNSSSSTTGRTTRSLSTQHSNSRASSAGLQPSRIPTAPSEAAAASSNVCSSIKPAHSLSAGVSGIPAAPGAAEVAVLQLPTATPSVCSSAAAAAVAVAAGGGQSSRSASSLITTASSAAATRPPVVPRSSSQTSRDGSSSSSSSSSKVAGGIGAGSGVNDGARRVSAASGSGSSCRSSSSSSTVHAIDYIREQREIKELARREQELDAQLRTLHTSQLPSKPTPQQLQALLQCAY